MRASCMPLNDPLAAMVATKEVGSVVLRILHGSVNRNEDTYVAPRKFQETDHRLCQGF